MMAAPPVIPVVMVGKDTNTEDEEEIVEKQEPTTACTENSKKTRKPGTRQYIWCPIQGCLSGSVQKLMQHLRQVHKLAPHKIARFDNPENSQYATPEAVQKKKTMSTETPEDTRGHPATTPSVIHLCRNKLLSLIPTQFGGTTTTSSLSSQPSLEVQQQKNQQVLK